MLIANTQGLLHFSAMAGFAGEQLGQVIGVMPAGSSCLQVRGDGHSRVLLAGPLGLLCVEQHWGHFQTPSPNFQHHSQGCMCTSAWDVEDREPIRPQISQS